MRKKVCLITGATSGLGRAAARRFAERGYLTAIVGRSRGRCQRVCAQVRTRHPGAEVDYWIADLSCIRQIDGLARRLAQKYNCLDVLVNNAGAKFRRRMETTEGIEATFALNHLGYFHLTVLLLPLLAAGRDARIINVASGAHSSAQMYFEDLQGKGHYNGKCAYNQSKLCNVLFTYELSRRVGGYGITVNAVNPGGMMTRFALNNGIQHWMKHIAAQLWMKDIRTPAAAAKAVFHLATAPDLRGVNGRYFDGMQQVSSSVASYDTTAAERLWRLSQELTHEVSQAMPIQIGEDREPLEK